MASMSAKQETYPVLIKPDGTRHALRLSEVAKAIGGAPESVELEEDLVLVVNDNFLALQLPLNEEASGLAKTLIQGPAVLMTQEQWFAL